MDKNLKEFLDSKVEIYNRPSFIAKDPIAIPHHFSNKPDIEIAGFFAAVLSWGNRTTIVKKSKELMARMDHAPHQFVMQYRKSDLDKLRNFVHRTFQTDDLFYFIEVLHEHYQENESLESAFFPGTANDITGALNQFKQYFFRHEHQKRTEKHIASPQQKSSCKRLNMYLRWMVRADEKGVDFGIWKKVSPAQLICPVDLHVARVARKLGLLQRKQTDWMAALELTAQLRNLDKQDPVKYDFALFGLGIMEKF